MITIEQQIDDYMKNNFQKYYREAQEKHGVEEQNKSSEECIKCNAPIKVGELGLSVHQVWTTDSSKEIRLVGKSLPRLQERALELIKEHKEEMTKNDGFAPNTIAELSPHSCYCYHDYYYLSFNYRLFSNPPEELWDKYESVPDLAA